MDWKNHIKVFFLWTNDDGNTDDDHNTDIDDNTDNGDNTDLL